MKLLSIQLLFATSLALTGGLGHARPSPLNSHELSPRICRLLPYAFKTQASAPNSAVVGNLRFGRVLGEYSDPNYIITDTPVGRLQYSRGMRESFIELEGGEAFANWPQDDGQDNAIILSEGTRVYAILTEATAKSRLNADETKFVSGPIKRVVWSFNGSTPQEICSVRAHLKQGVEITP